MLLGSASTKVAHKTLGKLTSGWLDQDQMRPEVRSWKGRVFVRPHVLVLRHRGERRGRQQQQQQDSKDHNLQEKPETGVDVKHRECVTDFELRWWFSSPFWPLLKRASFFETTGAVGKIGLSLKLSLTKSMKLFECWGCNLLLPWSNALW